MAYDITVDPIREQILDNLEETLRGILPPAYGSRVAFVGRFYGNDFQVPSYPAAVIVPGIQRNDDSRLALIEHTLPVTILLMVRSQNWREAMERFMADARVALLADYTRGGVALTTRNAGQEIFDSAASSPLGGAQIDLEVLFRTLYHDPGAAI